MTTRYQELQQLGEQFLDAFNRADVDAIVDFFTEDAVYEELHGKAREGKDAIRKSFENLLAGQFGTVRFDEDDTFIDADANKVMSSWQLSLTMDDKPVVLSGLDLLYFEGNQIARKLTYVKAKAPLYLQADG